jgi:hypothetical protein
MPFWYHATMKLFVVLLSLVSVLFSGVELAERQAATKVPDFAVVTADSRRVHVFSPADHTNIGANRYVIDDPVLRARVSAQPGSQWRLEILQAKQELRTVYFPYQQQRDALDQDIRDDLFYYPHLLGITEKAVARNTDWAWWGMVYPGPAFAPFVIVGDSDDARIVAATNWPPKTVSPLYAAQRMVLRYDTPVPAGTSAVFQALIKDVKGDPARKIAPWQMAVDSYRQWLANHVPAPSYPEWMWKGQGFLNVQLQNRRHYDISSIKTTWDKWKTTYPWILFWGQMSDYAEGCCSLEQDIHERYRPSLIQFVRADVVGAGYRAGYYAVPQSGASGTADRALETGQGRAWLQQWLRNNARYGANTFYVDTLGRGYWGEPKTMRGLFTQGVLSPDTLIEGVVDIYPSASLVSGSLVGTTGFCGAPYKQPKDSPKTTFARLGRYLLNDRLVYLGESNTDYMFWGASKNWEKSDFNAKCSYSSYCEQQGLCEHWTEVQAFLLGAKLDVQHPDNNPALDEIIRERQRVGWWGRQPIYLDTKGLDLRQLPADSKVEVRRFKDRSGVDLLVISNPRQLTQLTVGLNGFTYRVPNKRIAIMVLPQG